jgi:glycerol-3-phosphate acyltransferase PlsY
MIALVLDGIKGTVAVFFAVRFASDAATPVVAGLASIAGHVFPVWLNFRGGKGVATSAGVFAVLAPSSLGVAAGVFLATVWVTRHISVGSLAGATALVLSTAVANPLDVFFGAIVAAGMIGHRHRSNVSRLRAGTERRINLRLQQSTKVTDDGD